MTVRIITGDCREVLPTLPADSFDCVVTSPPYFGLRDYGVEGQIGLEPTLALYLETMVGVMREVRRVLKPSATCWLNLGDSYSSSVGGDRKISSGLKPKDLCMVPNRLAIMLQDDGWYVRSEIIWHKLNPMPESVTDRPTCAHEKVWLLTKSASYFYDADSIREPLSPISLAQIDYATKHGESSERIDKVCPDRRDGRGRLAARGQGSRGAAMNPSGASARNVWSIASEPYRGAHYAVMPSTLAERCIKAGSSEKGCCSKCGAPWIRTTEKGFQSDDRPQMRRARELFTEHALTNDHLDAMRSVGVGDAGKAQHTQTGYGKNLPEKQRLADEAKSALGGYYREFLTSRPVTTGWSASCACAADVQPCSVLDPFGGAGTTGLVADRLGRHATLIELNPANRELGAERVRMDGPLFAEVSA